MLDILLQHVLEVALPEQHSVSALRAYRAHLESARFSALALIT
jgi:hypothetical protein